jgi:hypothetical protein
VRVEEGGGGAWSGANKSVRWLWLRRGAGVHNHVARPTPHLPCDSARPPATARPHTGGQSAWCCGRCMVLHGVAWCEPHTLRDSSSTLDCASPHWRSKRER